MSLVAASIGALSAIVLAAALLFVSYVAAWTINGRGAPLTRWLIVVAGVYWIPTALFHALAAVRLFSLPFALLSLGLLDVLALKFAGGRPRLSAWASRDRIFGRRVATLIRQSPYKAAAIAFSVCAAPAFFRSMVLPPLGWDARTYHAVKAAMWVQHNGAQTMEGPGSWAYYRDMLAGGEVFVAWAILPFHNDTLVPLVDALEWLTLGAGLFVLGRRLRIKEPYASCATGSCWRCRQSG